MKALIFVPDQNTPGKFDVTGAFLPEARAFAKYHAVDEASIVRFPANAPLEQRRAVCTLAIKQAASPVDLIAFFCHGWKAGIQAGLLRQHSLLLARLLLIKAKPAPYVLLYACSTGRDLDDETADDRTPGPGGDGGFADGLRDACEVVGRLATVVGHTTEGHCTTNPHVRIFAPNKGGKGGEWVVEPQSELWPLWVAELKNAKSTLRFRFWQMTREEIAAELRGVPGPLVA